MEFKCVKECSQCCIEREYYPTKEFGKIGVFLLPEEKASVEDLARIHGIDVKILPRVGTSDANAAQPTRIIAYQMMGRDENGNTCPFLDTESEKRSPHGGFACKIYEKRPLACKAYPMIETTPITLDAKCKFCQQCGTADENLESETQSLTKIKSSIPQVLDTVWRYATGIGEAADRHEIRVGWVRLIDE